METIKTTEQMEAEIKSALVVMEEEGALSVIEQSRALVVTDIQTKKRSLELQSEAKLQRKRYADLIEPFKKALKARHTNACSKENELVGPFDDVINAERQKVATYNEEERVKLAKEAEERAAKEAAERAEKVAEAQKKLDEAIDASKDAQETLDLLYMMLDEDNPSEEQAQVIRAKITSIQAVIDGASREAAEAAAKAQMEQEAPPSAPAMAPPKVAGEVQGWKYKVEVTNMQELCKAIGEGKITINAVKAADGKLNSLGKDGTIKDGQYGCHVTREPTSHTRA